MNANLRSILQKIFDYTLQTLCPGGVLPPLGNGDAPTHGTIENRHLAHALNDEDDSEASTPTAYQASQRKKQKRITYDDDDEEEEDEDDEDDNDDDDDNAEYEG